MPRAGSEFLLTSRSRAARLESMRPMARRHSQRRWALACVLGLLGPLAACEPNVVVGSWSCPAPDGDGGEGNLSVPSSWATGFEDGFCAYSRVGGRCYQSNGAFDTVSSPVHSGKTAAAFTAKPDGGQSRCYVQGGLPEAAFYGAWYFIPSAPSALDNWNLFHFRGGDSASTADKNLWDVTITEAANGSLRLSVLKEASEWHHAEGVPPVPLGSWFHIQVHLRRSATATGAFALYQDGVRAVSLEDIVTDTTTYGAWYVGNLLFTLPPPESTVYVDDVTIQPEL